MASDLKRRGFLDLWLEDLREDALAGGFVSLIPFWLLGCIVIAYLAQTQISIPEFSKPETYLVFFTALLTLNGLLLTLSWISFSKIFELVADRKFSILLERGELIDKYHFMIYYINSCQIAAILFSMTALLYFACHLPALGGRIVFVATIASTLYAFRYAVGSIHMMQDIVWYRAKFDQGNHEVDNDSRRRPTLVD